MCNALASLFQKCVFALVITSSLTHDAIIMIVCDGHLAKASVIFLASFSWLEERVLGMADLAREF